MSKEWAPDACTLPSAERPLRIAEFDGLFAFVVRAERRDPTRLDLVLPRDVEAAAIDLARRESECCTFFTFDFEAVGDGVVMHITVPQTQADVLDALAARCGRMPGERAQTQ
jgi:hypothetical protein